MLKGQREPMQLRLRTRCLEIGARATGMTQRALDVTVEHALQRITFGVGVLRSRRWSNSVVRATSVSEMFDAAINASPSRRVTSC